MDRYVLAVRPEPGLTATLEAGKRLGLNMVGHPLFEIEPLDWVCPDPREIDALLIGSANAIRQGGAQLEQLKAKPVYAVGETTAATAREHGFEVAAIGEGGLQNVVDAIAPPIRLLRIAGAEHVALDARKEVNIHTVIAYESVAQPLPEDLRVLHESNLMVLLHSAAAAREFSNESKRLSLDRSRIELATIGPRVALAAGEGWRALHVSPEPNDRALLEMVRDVCI